MKIKEITDFRNHKYYITRSISWTSVLACLFTLILWIIKGTSFLYELPASIFICCFIRLTQSGIYLIDTLIDSKWRVKEANTCFPIYKELVLLVFYTALFLLFCPDRRTYYLLLYPLGMWIVLIIIKYIEEWWNRI